MENPQNLCTFNPHQRSCFFPQMGINTDPHKQTLWKENSVLNAVLPSLPSPHDSGIYAVEAAERLSGPEEVDDSKEIDRTKSDTHVNSDCDSMRKVCTGVDKIPALTIGRSQSPTLAEKLFAVGTCLGGKSVLSKGMSRGISCTAWQALCPAAGQH